MVIARRLGLALALVAVAALVTALLFAPAKADELVKGTNLISLQLTTGDADFGTPDDFVGSEGEVTAYSHSEWGGQLQLQHMLSDKWALAVSYGIGTFKETNEYGEKAPPNLPDGEYSQSSWYARIGADRFVSVADGFQLFAGPGIEYWSGDAKFDFPAYFATSFESESTTRISLTARIGVNIDFSSSLALNGYLGSYLGSASTEDSGAKASWMPSGNQAALGLALRL